MTGVTSLNANAEVMGRQAALFMNINAAKGLEDVMKTNLGPKGTIKMLVSGAGGATSALSPFDTGTICIGWQRRSDAVIHPHVNGCSSVNNRSLAVVQCMWLAAPERSKAAARQPVAQTFQSKFS